MGISIFVDRNCKPTLNEIFEVVSTSNINLQSLLNIIERKFKAKSEFKFYGKNYGWALNFQKSGKSFISIYPGNGIYTVQIILDKNQVIDAMNSNITECAKGIISSTEEIHEGRWIYIKVTSERDINDIETLLFIRSKKY